MRDDGLKGFLEEVRVEVCARCACKRGDTLCGTQGTPCGQELPLAQLVDAVQDPAGPPRTGYCSCPPEELSDLAAEVTRDLEERQDRRNRQLDLWADG